MFSKNAFYARLILSILNFCVFKKLPKIIFKANYFFWTTHHETCIYKLETFKSSSCIITHDLETKWALLR